MTTTTTTTTTVPVPRTAEPCAAHNVRHRPGTATAIACAARTAAAHPAAAPAPPAGAPSICSALEVTTEHLRAVIDGWDLVLARITTSAGPILMVAPGWCARGEVVVDRDDIAVLLDHLGSLEAVAADLTVAEQWMAGRAA